MRRSLAVLITTAFSVTLVACGGTAESAGNPETPPATISVQPTAAPTVAKQPLRIDLREWSIASASTEIKPGSVTIVASNPGRILHDLVIIKSTADAAKLPVLGDRVDESGLPIVGRFQEFKSGEKEKTFDLDSGRYILICNLPDHYTDGMFSVLTVK